MKKYFIFLTFILSINISAFAQSYVGGTSDGKDYNGNIVADVPSGTYTEIIGGNSAGGNVNGNITLDLTGIDVNGSVFGGNRSGGDVSGQVTINFNSGTINMSGGTAIYGGSYLNHSTVGAVELNLKGGNVTAGDIVASGTKYAHVMGDVVVNMTAGNITKILAVNGAGCVGGSTYFNISGGTVGDIYAGGQGNASVIGGSTNIILSGDAVVTGDVYAGSWYNERGGTIKGGTNITISDNATVAGSINGGGLSGSGTIEGAKTLNISNYTGSETLNVSNFSELSVNDTASITLNGALELDNLAIDKNSSLSLSAGSSIDSYTLVFADSLKEGEDLSLDGFKDIKIGEETIVLSSLLDDENNISSFTVMDASGQEFKLALDENKQFVVGTAVPEPSIYAVIFGAIALGFVMYRRR